MILRKALVSFKNSIYYLFEPPPLGEKGFCEIATVTQSVSHQVNQPVNNHFSSKMAHRFFMKLHESSWCLKGKKVTDQDFLEKSH